VGTLQNSSGPSPFSALTALLVPPLSGGISSISAVQVTRDDGKTFIVVPLTGLTNAVTYTVIITGSILK
jgi:hypothetical protein